MEKLAQFIIWLLIAVFLVPGLVQFVCLWQNVDSRIKFCREQGFENYRSAKPLDDYIEIECYKVVDNRLVTEMFVK